MPKQYTKEELRKLYKNLPDELKESLFSEETANDIENICDKNDYDNNSEIARYAGRVLMGLIPPEEFQETLEKKLKIKKETAKEIARETNRFIFYPVKELINSINKISNTVEQKELPEKEVKKEENGNIKKENTITTSPDSYREEIE